MSSEWDDTDWAGTPVQMTTTLQTRESDFPGLTAQLAAIRSARTQPWHLPTIREALSVPAISRAVSLISNSVGSLSMQGWRDEVPMAETPRILQRPDPFQTPREAYRDMAYCLATRGETVLWIAARDTDGLAVSLVVVPLSELTVENNPRNRLYPIYTWGTLKSTRYSPANTTGDFVHITYLKEPGALRGMGPLQLSGAATSVSVEAQEWAANFFADGGYPSIIIKKADFLAPGEDGVSEADILRNQWVSRPNNTPRVIDAGIESVSEHSPNPQGAQMLDAREHQNGDAARMFGIPGILLEYARPGSSLTYQNITEVFTEFVKSCLNINYLEPIEQGLSDLLPRQTMGRFNVDAFTRADIKTRFEVYESGITKSGVLTVEEARAAEGLAPGNVEFAPQLPSPPTAIPTRLPDNGQTNFFERSDLEFRCSGKRMRMMNGITKVADCGKLLARGSQAPVGMACPRCKKVYEDTAPRAVVPSHMVPLRLREVPSAEVEPVEQPKDVVLEALAAIARRLEAMEERSAVPVAPVQPLVIAAGAIQVHQAPITVESPLTISEGAIQAHIATPTTDVTVNPAVVGDDQVTRLSDRLGDIEDTQRELGDRIERASRPKRVTAQRDERGRITGAVMEIVEAS